jgi:cation diffusion facilitator family transporter
MSPPQHLHRYMLLSIGAAIVTIGMKGTAYALTDSVGLLSDALESLINLIAALTAYVAIWYASRPADSSHTYGHEKIEYFSSGLEGVLIILAGLGTAAYAVKRLIHPEPLQNLELGTVIGLAASGVNFAVARVLLLVGRKHHSIVLEADGQHLMSDVWTSVGVVAGLGLVVLTGLTWIDPVLAIVVGLNIVWTGGELVLRSFNGLMDHSLPAEEQGQIRGIITTLLPPGASFHMLKSRRAGQRRFVEFHLLLNGDITVRAAHRIAHEVQSALVEAFQGLEVMIHIEPVDEQDSWEREEMRNLGETPDAATASKQSGGTGTAPVG